MGEKKGGGGGGFKTGKTQCSLASSRDSGCREGEKKKKRKQQEANRETAKGEGYSFLFINLQENLWIGLWKIKPKARGGRGRGGPQRKKMRKTDGRKRGAKGEAGVAGGRRKRGRGRWGGGGSGGGGGRIHLP